MKLDSRSRPPKARHAMAVVLFIFTLFSIAVFGMIALLARAVRTRTPPNERCDLEDNSITPAEWEWVRRARCGPRHCPRAVGSPLRPRGDVVCEICAAVYMERHWRRLLGVTSAEELAGILRASRRCESAEHAAAPHAESVRHPPVTLPMLTGDDWESTDITAPTARRARLARRVGLLLTLAGAGVLALTAAPIPGSALVASGIGLVLRSRHAGG
jgi:hypothetical protein